MKKKWLCLFVLISLAMVPLTGLGRMESRRMLSRALTEVGRGAAEETMLALGSVVLNRAGSAQLGPIRNALAEVGFARGFRVNERATRAAQAVLAGERTLAETVTDVALQAPDELPYTALGGFYFY